MAFSCSVVIPLCGGNIDTTALGRCIDRGLAADGRLVRFKVTIVDRPGGIMQLASVVADSGARCRRRVCMCVCVCMHIALADPNSASIFKLTFLAD